MHASPETDLYIRTLTVRASKIDVSADEKRLTGYAIVFDQQSEDLGGWKEVIRSSAVDRTLREGTNVDALVDHKRETGSILGSTDSGLLRLRKDHLGLRVEIFPPDTTSARDVITTVKSGLVRGMSFSFRAMPDGTTWDQEGDFLIRYVNDMQFNEVSIVLNPAYKQTEIHARAAALDLATLSEFRAQTWKRSLKFRERELRAKL